MKSAKLLTRCLGTICLFGLSNTLWADTLTASVDRETLSLNETLNLVLEYDEQVNTRQLDLSVLQRDFEVLSNSSASQVSIINGRQDVSTRWNLTLLPNRAGRLLIPSFQIDGNYSEAIGLEVTEPENTGARTQPINVEVEISDESVVEMQQLLVKVRLIAAGDVRNLSGDNFAMEGAEIDLLDQKQFSQVEDGRNWQIIEWAYAIFADQAGSIEIPPQVFSGVVGSNRSVYDPFGTSGQRVLARSEAIQVAVTPAESQQNWLPASELLIESEWPSLEESDSNEIRVGEPITRNITIAAVGQRMESIPPLADFSSESFKQYADQPQLFEQTREDALIGVRRESAAIVPTKAGEMVLPEVRIPWWDTDEGAWKEAVLPEERINVLEAETSASLAPPQSFSDPVTLEANSNQLLVSDPFWKWVSATMTLISVILAWILLRTRSRGYVPAPAEKQTTGVDANEQRCWAQLQKDIKKANPAEVRASLERWCRAKWPTQSGSALANLSSRLSGAAKEELKNLDRAIYGNQTDAEVQMNDLAKELRNLRKASSDGESGQSALAPLYPVAD